MIESENDMKYIFVSGGVLSGLGKGVTAASLGVTLKARGYKVTPSSEGKWKRHKVYSEGSRKA